MAQNVVLLVMVVLCCLSSMSNAALRVPMKRLHPHITTQQNLTAAVQRSIARIKTIEASIAAAINASKSSSQAFPQAAIEAPVSVGSGEFVMAIGIGTPPTKMVAIVDTGSDLIWTQCQPCTTCFPQTDPVFDPSQSTTYMSNVSCDSSLCSSLPRKSCTPDCEYLYKYGDGSTTSGVLSLETLSMLDTSGGQYPIPGIAFGCSHDSQGLFRDTDGLVGLGRGELSLISQLGSLGESKFSYCLISEDSSASETSPLLFGSAAGVGEEAKSTPILTNPAIDTFYYLSVEGISVGNSMANILEGTFDIKGDGSGGFIIDSGTTLTALPHAAFTAVADILDSTIGLPRAAANASPVDLCYQLPSASATATVPMITFHFIRGADYVIGEENSFITIHEKNLLCFLMLNMDESSTGVSIFGNYQQQNYHILYDNEQQMLSFAPADCASL